MVSGGSSRSSRVRTAVIPAAGQGTRMLPATKSVPKELLPLGEKPALQYIIEEAAGAGVEHIVVISSPTKPALADYVAPSPAVERVLEKLGRDDLAEEQRRIGSDIAISIVVQEEARGLGHAVACARDAVGDESFFVMLPDELMENSSLLLEMAEVHESTGTSVIAVKPMPREEISRYGVVAPVGEESPSRNGRVVTFDDVVEKPSPRDAPSDLAIIGRYLLTPDIFDDLDRIAPGANGEFQLTDALALQSRRRHSSALVSTIHRRDIGHPIGWVKAVIEHALGHPTMGAVIRSWMSEELAREPGLGRSRGD